MSLSFGFFNDICDPFNRLFSKISRMKDFSYITNSSPAFIENLYRDFVKDPDSVDPEMKKFFEGFDFAISSGSTNGKTTNPVTEAPAPGKTTSVDVDWMRELRAYR